jgi:hypothetical protein
MESSLTSSPKWEIKVSIIRLRVLSNKQQKIFVGSLTDTAGSCLSLHVLLLLISMDTTSYAYYSSGVVLIAISMHTT